MDSMIPNGQKNTLAESMILFGAHNHPPMLHKDFYDSWKSRMELYMQNRENGRMILESVEHGPLIWPTIKENGVTETKNLLNSQGKGKVLNEEELEFLADLGTAEGPVTQSVITHTVTYQDDDLDAYDSDCDEISIAKAVLMTNFSSYGSYVISEVPYFDNTHNDMLNQSVQEMPYFEQTHLMNYLENEITSDSNIIPYSQYLLETQNAVVQDTNSSA
nr:hypothetical protein [Tanacetum cinerariifolium]